MPLHGRFFSVSDVRGNSSVRRFGLRQYAVRKMHAHRLDRGYDHDRAHHRTAMTLPAEETGGMRRGWKIGLVAGSIVMLAALLALGTWQVQRLHWKEGLLA